MLTNDLVKKIADENLNVYSVAMMDQTGIHTLSVIPANQCNNSYSISKFYTAAAIGMLWDRKLLRTDETLFEILGDEFPEQYDLKWKEVTVEHLLTHTAGFDHGVLDVDVEDIHSYPGDDFLKVVLAEPLPYAPGTHYQYTDAVFYLLSRIVSRISGKRLDDFLRPVLFGKLGFGEFAWSVCPRGYSMGGTGLYLRTSDMVKLGYVYANEGSYNGERILSPEWIHLSMGRGYGFRQLHDTGIYAKGGSNGQKLCFCPEKKVAYAWHAYETQKSTDILLEWLV